MLESFRHFTKAEALNCENSGRKQKDKKGKSLDILGLALPKKLESRSKAAGRWEGKKYE